MISNDFDKKNSNIVWKFFGVVLYVFTFLVAIVGIVYLVWSLVLMILSYPDASSPGKFALEFILNFLALIVEFVGIFYTVILIKHMSSTCFNPPSIFEEELVKLDEYPLVSILIPIRNPDPTILDETLNSIKKLDYPSDKLTVYLGDDTDSNHISFSETCKLANKYEAEHIHDPSNIHFKAGMLNILLQKVSSEYFVLLDYDHIVAPSLLKKAIKLMTNNSQLAFVQAKVNFRHVYSKLQVWESVMYAQFYEVFQRSKTKRFTTLTNGSTVCFRKSFIDEIGGIPQETFTEDVDISVSALAHGYQTALIDSYESFGLIPATFSLLLSQILRWAKGSMQVLKKRWKKILSAKIPLVDRIDLLFSSSLFLIASSVYLTLIFYVIMYFTGSKVIRLPIPEFPWLLIMPIAFAFSYQISAIISILFARRSGIKNIKLLDLVYFLLLALVLNPFTVFAVLKSLFSRRIPTREKDEWNEKIPYLILSFIITSIGSGLLVIAIMDIIETAWLGHFWLVLGLLGLSMVATFPVCVYFHFTTKHNKPYFMKRNSS